MSAIASRLRRPRVEPAWGALTVLRRHWVELAWGAFAAVNLLVMFRLDTALTVPFHFVWVSLTLVYGFRTWAPRPTLIVCVAVCGLTGAAFLEPIMAGRLNPDELTEVPLMAGMFLAMVWHARRRVAAIEEVRRLADSEHRLREREREFVRDASHSLRTPITVARGYTELIRGAHATTQTSEDAGVVLGELHKLTLISERLLTLARAEQADFLRRAALDLEALLTRTARRWTAAAPRRWQVQVDDDGELLADAEQLESALDALIENAVAATKVDGRILLRARAEYDHAVIEVVDDGSGIRPEHLARVFDRFWRVDNDPASDTRGTGLGLAIVKAIAQAHGGTVSVASQPGGGSTFTVRLPGLHTNGQLASPHPSPTTLHPS
jgi:two-component system, OmpR family, sensor kinase